MPIRHHRDVGRGKSRLSNFLLLNNDRHYGLHRVKLSDWCRGRRIRIKLP